MNAFVCWTSYQLINAINVRMRLDTQPADLYLCDYFSDARRLYEAVSGLGLFAHVYFCEDDADLRLKHGYIHQKMWMAKKALAKLVQPQFNPAQQYDTLYTFGFFPLARLIHAWQYKMNPAVRLVFVDEGLQNYISPLSGGVPGRLRVLYKILRLPLFQEHIEKNLLYRPDWLVASSQIPTEPLPMLHTDDQALCDALDRLFPVDPQKIGPCGPVLFLDQPMFEALTSRENERYEAALVDMLGHLADRAGKQSITVKMHPRNASTLYRDHGIAQLGAPGIGMEVLLFNRLIDSRIYVTIFSTAALEPKMLFDQEPVLLCVHRLFQDYIADYKLDGFEKLLKRVKQSYRDPDKVLIPDTLQQLDACMDTINTNNW